MTPTTEAGLLVRLLAALLQCGNPRDNLHCRDLTFTFQDCNPKPKPLQFLHLVDI